MEIIAHDLGPGWQPVTHMAGLAAELLGARLTRVHSGPGSLNWAHRLSLLRPRRRGAEPCLIILPAPGSLYACSEFEGWQGRFGHVAVWVIDSFWHEWIPRFARFSRNVDQVFVTNPEDVEPWRRRTGIPTAALPWGADVLGLGSARGDRSTDLLRFGRQPTEWAEDDRNRDDAASLGIRYGGRPPIAEDATENQRMLMRALSDTRYTLCFTNTVDRFSYTHPGREYVTARWMDALACGAVVAGLAPKCDVVDTLLWPGALLELGTPERSRGLQTISEALRSWMPEVAARNHYMALSRVDWRWRFQEIAAYFGISCPRLERDIAEMKRRVEPANLQSSKIAAQSS